MTENETLAYCAGLLEAEGTIQISKSFAPSTIRKINHFGSISIGMMDKEPLELFKRKFGGYLNATIKHNKVVYTWEVHNKHASLVVNKLLPFMLISRKRQAGNCLIKLVKTINIRRSRKVPIALSIIEKREALYQECKKLNAKGINANNSQSLNDLDNFNFVPELAYLAGVHDGDGSSNISHYTRCSNYGCQLSLKMADAECVKAFYNRFGGHLGSSDRAFNHKTIFSWQESGHRASEIAKELLPLLTIERKKKALECIIEFVETICPIGTYRSTELKKHQELLHKQCREYNQQAVKEIAMNDINSTLQLTFLESSNNKGRN